MPDKPELKVKEFELFRAYYCGVCKTIGALFGQIPRFTLNYDTTFLALLLSSVGNKNIKACMKRCAVHPVKKKYTIDSDPVIEYASDMNVLLAYYNLLDKRNDGDSKTAAVALPVLKPAYRKLKAKYAKKCDIIESKLEELKRLEKEGCSSMDRASEPFARIMEEVLAFEPLMEDENNGQVLKWLGYNMGKWIYILDAFDDIGKDIEKKSYNPLVLQFNYQSGDVEEFKKTIRDRVEFNLTYTMSEISKAYELLDIKKNAGILENIIFMGMLKKAEQILKIGVA